MSAGVDPRCTPAIAGSRNFRDLGGYATADGRHVRWGLLYRSGSLAGITGDGRAALAALGIRSLCDLRTSRECAAEPVAWHGDLGVGYWRRDHETSFGELRSLMEAGMATGGQARDAMLAGYRRLPFEQAPAYRELFRLMAAGAVPLVFNCSAGKDRAGTGAALILTALGVAPETVAADYALTDRLVDLAAALARPAGAHGTLGRQPAAVVRAILGCDPDYIRAAMDAVTPRGAPIERYLDEVLGVDAAMLAAIRERFLDRDAPPDPDGVDKSF